MTVTVCIQDEQGKEQTHEVSDEFMELCFERAKVISLEVLDLVKEMNAEQWYDTIREKSKRERKRSTANHYSKYGKEPITNRNKIFKVKNVIGCINKVSMLSSY